MLVTSHTSWSEPNIWSFHFLFGWCPLTQLVALMMPVYCHHPYLNSWRGWGWWVDTRSGGTITGAFAEPLGHNYKCKSKGWHVGDWTLIITHYLLFILRSGHKLFFFLRFLWWVLVLSMFKRVSFGGPYSSHSCNGDRPRSIPIWSRWSALCSLPRWTWTYRRWWHGEWGKWYWPNSIGWTFKRMDCLLHKTRYPNEVWLMWPISSGPHVFPWILIRCASGFLPYFNPPVVLLLPHEFQSNQLQDWACCHWMWRMWVSMHHGNRCLTESYPEYPIQNFVKLKFFHGYFSSPAATSAVRLSQAPFVPCCWQSSTTSQQLKLWLERKLIMMCDSSQCFVRRVTRSVCSCSLSMWAGIKIVISWEHVLVKMPWIVQDEGSVFQR